MRALLALSSQAFLFSLLSAGWGYRRILSLLADPILLLVHMEKMKKGSHGDFGLRGQGRQAVGSGCKNTGAVE